MPIYVQNGESFRRIDALPKHSYGPKYYEQLRRPLTQALHSGSWLLNADQTASLIHGLEAGGLFAELVVGAGKSLVSYLLPTLWEAQRPLLITKGNLVRKARHELVELRREWQIKSNLVVMSYDALSHGTGMNVLERLEPDAIMCDEAHSFRDLTSGRTRRFMRWAVPRMHAIKFAFLSGTMSKSSIKDYAHLLRLALKDQAPVPFYEETLHIWSLALDARIRDDQRAKPGPLLKWAKPEDFGTDIDRARMGYRRRCNATLGIVRSQHASVDAGLEISEVGRSLEIPEVVLDAVAELKKTAMRPDGEIILEAAVRWAVERQLVQGFFYKLDPPPPAHWKMARAVWHAYVRDRLKEREHGIDTAGDVQENDPGAPELLEWLAVKDDYQPLPHHRPEWLDDFVVDYAHGWLRKKGGIAWVEHRAVGERIAEKHGWRYFGADIESARDIESCKDPFVASIDAHGTGRNLQHNHYRNLLISPPPTGIAIEQLLGRTHRQGQPEDTVEVDVLLHSPLVEDGWNQAKDDCVALAQKTGMPYKLNLATYIQ